MSVNDIVDVAPLVDLPALKSLSLDSNALVDPDPLAGLHGLESLRLGLNPLKPDIGALVELDALVDLGIEFTGVTALHAFAPQTLSQLSAAGNAIVDLGPLAGHVALSHIDLRSNALTTLQPLLAAPFWDSQCVDLNLADNPLDADVLAEQIPALCAQGESIQGSGAGCLACEEGEGF
ncbi:hypothetical protein OV203_47565 [Nannocystis sp. ILAH1]|uniref:hypothetical protein n=1 Tax=unclassified Nannocystis TaxID=2627009 RepID=UPI00227223FD|nr:MULTISPECIES: hypothetical protein [unclassified Nannocystis]MCY0994878.1 hypothetical protein [Nannocystis sp. ILAH1]MCY1065293.1 hypothetical protein [Nannocystis sp. RBIL2]